MHKKTLTPFWLPIVAFGLGLALPLPAIAGTVDCGELKNFSDIGPWDYADPSSSVPTGADPMGRIKRVENVHFKPDIRNLNTKKYSILQLTAEIHYTLSLFPNNPYALNAISRLEQMAGGKLPQNTVTPYIPKITADCFFDRATRFRPDDKAVRMVYGMHLQKRGKLKDALAEYERAEALGEESASFYYNFGLLHADMKNWDQSHTYAVKAQQAGLMLPGLRSKLEKAGRPLPALSAAKAATASDSAARK